MTEHFLRILGLLGLYLWAVPTLLSQDSVILPLLGGMLAAAPIFQLLVQKESK